MHITEDANELLAEAIWDAMLPHLPRSVKRPRKAMQQEEEARRKRKRKRRRGGDEEDSSDDEDATAGRSAAERRVKVFFARVKRRFAEKRDSYVQFIRLMASLQNKSPEHLNKTVKAIAKLFERESQPELIGGLNRILPEHLRYEQD